ncbi:hypothetical protein J2S43_002022 [Catenuloplanes nepalensis]|uniref:Aminoglycoside phosphotransferase n=1 Tax=Catenuloplanes nepalensis TaxID=587533 RepID=A0ABT9MQ22_9ACTN|nr:hypothetical protein [Catenuloplanes nepalensis]MDP9793510.1 hypothetical protein [Catenuloplanes nepalensis]
MTVPMDLVRDGWVAEPLEHGSANEVTGGVWRVRRDDGPAVLKVATPRRAGALPHLAASADPGHSDYWRREPCAYEAGLPGTVFAAGGLSAPECRSVRERADGSVAMWLEDVPGVHGKTFGPAELGDVAVLDEVLETVTDAYVRGLHGTLAPDAVRRAIRVTGAAKFFWMAPRMIVAAGGATIGSGYDRRDVTARFTGRAPILQTITDRADSI